MGRLAACVLVGVLAQCAPVRNPQPAREATVLCIGNTAGGSPMPAIERHARVICEGFRARGVKAVDAPPDYRMRSGPPEEIWPDLGRSWARSLTSSASKVLFYEGHGTPGSCPGSREGRGVCLFAPGGGRFGWEGLARSIPGAEAQRGWRVLVLNSCDSSHADVRGVPAPFTLLSSGYGKLPSAPFADGLQEALSDPETDRNCDGVISDRDLQEVLGQKLQKVASSPVSNPMAIVRREADTDVPVLWTIERSDRCEKLPTLERLQSEPGFARLPCELRRNLQQQQQMLSGTRKTLVESVTRYLVVSDERTRCVTQRHAAVDADLRRALVEHARLLGYSVIDAPAGDSAFRDFLDHVVRLAVFSSFYSLEVTDVALRLSSLRDGYAAKTVPGDFGRCEREAEPAGPPTLPGSLEILRCLPTRVQLTDPSSGALDSGCRQEAPLQAASGPCISIQGVQSCYSLHVDGRFPRRDVSFVAWSDFWAHGAAASRERLDLREAKATPCAAGVGQCFQIASVDGRPRVPQDWLLLEAEVVEEDAPCEG
jgi:hypothetical protein